MTFSLCLRRVLAATLLGFASAPTLAVEPPTDLDAEIRSTMAGWGVPGLAFAVVQDGKVVLARGYGTRELGRDLPVNEQTIFGIGSMTKSFTAAAAAILVGDGKLSWEDKVIDHLPGFRFHDAWITEHATVRDLASHRVGIDANFPWVARAWPVQDTLDRVRHLPSRARFGNYDYSNTGILALGRIVEIVAGQDWERFIAQRIFAPLGMKRSNTREDAYVDGKSLARCWLCTPPAGAIIGQGALKDRNAASPHGVIEGPRSRAGETDRAMEVLAWRHEGSIAAAGAINSTAMDMAQWLLLHLNEGKAGGKQVIAAEQVRQIHAYQSLTEFPALEPATDASPLDQANRVPGYGLGWGKRLYRGYLVSAHGGGQVGFGTMMWIVPEKKLGVVVLQNADFRQSQAYAAIGRRLLDHYLGLPPLDWNQYETDKWNKVWDEALKVFTSLDAGSQSAAPPNAASYAGVYASPALGEVTIAQENTALVLRFGNDAAADLRRINDQNFLAIFRGADRWRSPVHFSIDMSGKAGSFVFSESFGEAGTFTFTRTK
jgi:CubicO group peptidase (beta-lactamase class C family)